MTRTLAAVLALCAALPLVSAQGPGVVPPPNEPAVVELAADHLILRYHGGVIFEGTIAGSAALARLTVNASRTGSAVDQVVALTASAGPILVSGIVSASGEAFPAEADRPLRGLPIVRHASGLSRSLRNHAVYDRKWDWVLSVDDQPRTRTRVTPLTDSRDARTFRLEASGREILLRFRPRYYQRHRGLRYFEPWTYAIWPSPVAGWCSWFAFFDKVSEDDIKRTADVVASTLAPFGYEYIQMDDGYQRATGAPEFWLQANQKFPSGLAALAGYIKGKGLKPAIWTNAAFSQTDIAEGHKDWFVRDSAGGLARGNLIDLVVDGSNPAALAALVRPIYRELRSQGWEYFKLDALRHLRYEGYNANGAHFARTGVERADAFRAYVRSVREEIGRDSVPDGLLGHAARAGRHRGRLPPGHRRLLVRRAGAVQLLQQRRLAQRSRLHRTERGRGVAVDDGDLADRDRCSC